MSECKTCGMPVNWFTGYNWEGEIYCNTHYTALKNACHSHDADSGMGSDSADGIGVIDTGEKDVSDSVMSKASVTTDGYAGISTLLFSLGVIAGVGGIILFLWFFPERELVRLAGAGAYVGAVASLLAGVFQCGLFIGLAEGVHQLRIIARNTVKD